MDRLSPAEHAVTAKAQATLAWAGTGTSPIERPKVSGAPPLPDESARHTLLLGPEPRVELLTNDEHDSFPSPLPEPTTDPTGGPETGGPPDRPHSTA